MEINMLENEGQESISEIRRKATSYERQLAKTGEIEIDIGMIDASDYERSFLALLKNVRGEDFDRMFEEIISWLEKIFLRFWLIPVDSQKEIIEVFRTRPSLQNVIVGYPAIAGKKIHDLTDSNWMELGLTSVVFLRGDSDFRDIYISLGSLFTDAQRSGIDAIHGFHNFISRLTKIGGPYSFTNDGRNLIEDFLNSEHFREIRKALNPNWHP